MIHINLKSFQVYPQILCHRCWRTLPGILCNCLAFAEQNLMILKGSPHHWWVSCWHCCCSPFSLILQFHWIHSFCRKLALIFGFDYVTCFFLYFNVLWTSFSKFHHSPYLRFCWLWMIPWRHHRSIFMDLVVVMLYVNCLCFQKVLNFSYLMIASLMPFIFFTICLKRSSGQHLGSRLVYFDQLILYYLNYSLYFLESFM